MLEKRFNPDKATVLWSEERRATLPAEKIIQYLELDKEDLVADLGAENGYFTIPMAKKIERQVHAVDIEPKMLSMLKERAEKEKSEKYSVYPK